MNTSRELRCSKLSLQTSSNIPSTSTLTSYAWWYALSTLGYRSGRKLTTTSIITPIWSSSHIKVVETVRSTFNEIPTKPGLVEELSPTYAGTARFTMTTPIPTTLDTTVRERSL